LRFGQNCAKKVRRKRASKILSYLECQMPSSRPNILLAIDAFNTNNRRVIILSIPFDSLKWYAIFGHQETPPSNQMLLSPGTRQRRTFTCTPLAMPICLKTSAAHHPPQTQLEILRRMAATQQITPTAPQTPITALLPRLATLARLTCPATFYRSRKSTSRRTLCH
jgi:hypothetical protein